MILHWRKPINNSFVFSKYKEYGKHFYTSDEIIMLFDKVIIRKDKLIKKQDLERRKKFEIKPENSIYRAVLMNLMNPEYKPFRVQFSDDNYGENTRDIYRR
ncbi:MAG: hypothetical protein ACOC3V_05220 [bacterium]